MTVFLILMGTRLSLSISQRRVVLGMTLLRNRALKYHKKSRSDKRSKRVCSRPREFLLKVGPLIRRKRECLRGRFHPYGGTKIQIGWDVDVCLGSHFEELPSKRLIILYLA